MRCVRPIVPKRQEDVAEVDQVRERNRVAAAEDLTIHHFLGQRDQADRGLRVHLMAEGRDANQHLQARLSGNGISEGDVSSGMNPLSLERLNGTTRATSLLIGLHSHGVPAPPQVQALSDRQTASNGLSGWASHTHPPSEHLGQGISE